MRDDFAREVATLGDNDEIRAILRDVCALTDMGFAAVARVTDDRWIACQVLDKIQFGLKSGDELEIHTTICNEIRHSGQGVVIDSIDDDAEWRTHPVPIIYGFKSYISLPIVTDNGAFFGTICAIDPAKRNISAAETVAIVRGFAKQLGHIFSAADLAT